MTEALSGGAVVIPAYLRDEYDVSVLADLLSGLPGIVDRRVVVAQPGPAGLPSLSELPDAEGLQVVSLSSGVGKWPAFAAGLERLDGHEPWVAVLDADGAFPSRCLAPLVAAMAAGSCSHMIGSRRPDAIDLRAVGADGSHLRRHLEAYSNTLTLLSLGESADSAFAGADLQCGIHLFAGHRLAGLARDSWPYYGGELQLFHDSIAGGHRVGFAPVEVAENPVSTYPIAEIIRGLFHLPFLAATERRLRERALREAPNFYPGWKLDPVFLASDLEPLLDR